MKNGMRFSLAVVLAGSPLLLMGAAHRSRGAWLHRVPATAHQQQNPIAANDLPAAAAAGEHVYQQECSHCHGADGMGRGSRPPVVSPRVAGASDGDLFWLITNGNPWHGMPPWQSLPPGTRWQIVAYLRELNTGVDTTGGQK